MEPEPEKLGHALSELTADEKYRGIHCNVCGALFEEHIRTPSTLIVRWRCPASTSEEPTWFDVYDPDEEDEEDEPESPLLRALHSKVPERESFDSYEHRMVAVFKAALRTAFQAGVEEGLRRPRAEWPQFVGRREPTDA